jgi:hypothetical protein
MYLKFLVNKYYLPNTKFLFFNILILFDNYFLIIV